MPRGQVASWSRQAAARNTAFLRAQPREGYRDGQAFAATLTLGRCPATSAEWQRLRKRFVDRLRRADLVRLHWVVEWTRRGWPHLHCSVWFPAGTADGAALILRHWLEVTDGHRTLARGQHVEAIGRFGGWARYVGKHAARGVRHYQRVADRLPEGWESSGRMWGHCGTWAPVEPVPTEVPWSAFHAFRRLARKLDAARARARGDLRGARAARRSLRSHNREYSAVRPLSEWTDREGDELLLLGAARAIVGDRLALASRADRDRADLASRLRTAVTDRECRSTG